MDTWSDIDIRDNEGLVYLSVKHVAYNAHASTYVLCVIQMFMQRELCIAAIAFDKHRF